MDNGSGSVTDETRTHISASDKCKDGGRTSLGDYAQASDKIVAPRFHLLTRPPQTEPFWVPPSHSADQTVGLLEATPLVSEDLVVQEFPYEGMQEGLYDLADPTVNLHEFIVSCLASPKDRLFLFRVEKVLVEFIEDTSQDLMEFPAMTSYHRMLLHRVAAYFGLDHNVGPSGLSVIVSKSVATRIPKARFPDLLPSGVIREESASPKLILKRNKASETREKVKVALANEHIAISANVKKSKTMAEREADYEKARARIFSQPVLPGEQSHQPLDKETQQQVIASNVAVSDDVQSHQSRHSPIPVTDSDTMYHMTRHDPNSHIPTNKPPQFYKPTIPDAPKMRHPLSPQTSTLQGVGLTRTPTVDFNPRSSYTPAAKMQYPQHMVTLGNESFTPNVHPMFVNQAAAMQQAQMMALLQAQQQVGFPRPNVLYPCHDVVDLESGERGMSRQQQPSTQPRQTLGDPHQQQMTSHLNHIPVHTPRASERPLYNLQQQQQQFLLQHQHALEQFHRFQLQQYQLQQLPYRSSPHGGHHLSGINQTHSPSPLDASCTDNDTGHSVLSPQQMSRPDSSTTHTQGIQQQERRDPPVKAYSAQRPSAAKTSGQPPTFALEVYEIQTSISDVVNELRGDGANVHWRNVQSPASGCLAFFKSHGDMQAALNRAQRQPSFKYKLRLPGRHLLQSFSHLSIT